MQTPQGKTISSLIQITIDVTAERKNSHDFDETIYKQDDLIQMQILKNILDKLFREPKAQEKHMLERLSTHDSRKTAHAPYASLTKR
jgi:hypothetical protein